MDLIHRDAVIGVVFLLYVDVDQLRVSWCKLD